MPPKSTETKLESLPPQKGRSGVAHVISALRRHDGNLATKEQKVADYVNAHPEDISGPPTRICRRRYRNQPDTWRNLRFCKCDALPDRL